MKKKRDGLYMVNGPLIPGILTFTLPLMLTSILQLLYNAADIIVVGRYVGKQALAAVGATASLINLLITVFLGLSVGASVAVANAYGAQAHDEVSDTVHTSIALSLISSVFVCALGLLACRPLLEMMGTPEDVIDLSEVYMRIYFLGVPGNLLYNFGSAILRAVGDTRRPLVILTIAGLVNVCLNLVFVIALGMSVDGVAWATIISQYLSAVMVTICLLRSEDCIRLTLRRIRIHWARLKEIVRVGLPAGFQGALFALSNVLIQSSLNTFGSAAVAGSSAAGNIEGFIYVMMNAMHQAAITFCGQNMGAKNYKRIPHILRACLLLTFGIYVVGCGAVILFCEPLLRIYNSDPMVLEFGRRKQIIMMAFYFFCGGMDVVTGQLRGMGYSLGPTLVVLTGVCGLRMVWLATVFVRWHTFEVLFYSYPVSWFVTFAALLACYFAVRRRLPKGDALIEQTQS